jgi:hypothetical protein
MVRQYVNAVVPVPHQYNPLPPGSPSPAVSFVTDVAPVPAATFLPGHSGFVVPQIPSQWVSSWDLRGRNPIYVHPQMPPRGSSPQHLPGRGPVYVHPQMPSQGFSPQHLPGSGPVYVHPQMPSQQQYLNPQFLPIRGDSSLLSSLIAKASGVYPTSPPSTWS